MSAPRFTADAAANFGAFRILDSASQIPFRGRFQPSRMLTADAGAQMAQDIARGLNALEALEKLRAGLAAIESRLNDEESEAGPQPPTGDDYNDLWSLVNEALAASGLASA